MIKYQNLEGDIDHGINCPSLLVYAHQTVQIFVNIGTVFKERFALEVALFIQFPVIDIFDREYAST